MVPALIRMLGWLYLWQPTKVVLLPVHIQLPSQSWLGLVYYIFFELLVCEIATQPAVVGPSRRFASTCSKACCTRK